jgi:hypothetical protein
MHQRFGLTPSPHRHHQRIDDKLRASHDWLEQSMDFDAPPHLGHIAAAIAPSWRELRKLPSFRPRHPALARWSDESEARPSMRRTPLSW